jgi:hypothetical protein
MASATAEVTFNNLPRIAARFPEETRKRVRAQAADTADDVRANIVGMDVIDTGAGLASTASDGESVWVGQAYMAFQDRGTVYIRARPFFTDAVQKARQEFPERFRDLEAAL